MFPMQISGEEASRLLRFPIISGCSELSGAEMNSARQPGPAPQSPLLTWNSAENGEAPLPTLEPFQRYCLTLSIRGSGRVLIEIMETRVPEPDAPPHLLSHALIRIDKDTDALIDFLPMQDSAGEVRVQATMTEAGQSASIEAASLERVCHERIRVEIAPPYAMVGQANQFEIMVHAERRKESSPARPPRILITGPEGTTRPWSVPIKRGEPVRCRFGPNQGESPGLYRLTCFHPDAGTCARSFLERVEGRTHETFLQLSERADIGKLPARLLFIGDSISDMHRGYNYTDKILYWLRTIHGSAVTVRNASVGGDTISRIRKRLEGDREINRLSEYDSLFDPEPTQVFIFVGHNDSKLSSASGYRNPFVPLDQFVDDYRAVIERIRGHCKADIHLISTTCSLFSRAKEIATAAEADGRQHNLFGEPKSLQRFNAAARNLAADFNLDFIDMFTPTEEYGSRETMFTMDGVHITNEGNRLLALEILRHLAK